VAARIFLRKQAEGREYLGKGKEPESF